MLSLMQMIIVAMLRDVYLNSYMYGMFDCTGDIMCIIKHQYGIELVLDMLRRIYLMIK